MGNKIDKGLQIGRYRIVRPLMDGGMGRVYEVEHADLGVRRAMKVFSADRPDDGDLRSRFFAEARILAGLDSPRIVRIHDFAADDAAGILYFTMDMVLSEDGSPRTLADPRCFGRSERTVAGWFADLCEGLDYVHSRNVVHGDVKLENALLGPDGRAVLADFGLSRLLGGVSGASAPSVPGDPSFIAGTVGYLPPETSGSDATPAMDAWALGVAAFRLLTGFWFDEREREGCLSLLGDYDLPWKGVLGRLLSDDPSARIPAEGLSSLARTLLDAAAEPPGPKARFARRPALVAASVALVAAFGAGVWFAASPRPTPAPAPDVPAECGEPGVLALPCPNPSARRWDDRVSNGYAALDESIILANIDKFPPAVADALRHALDRAISFYGYIPPYSLSEIDRLSEWIDSEMNAGREASANPAQLLLLAGEVHRIHRLYAPGGGLQRDEERIAELTLRFIVSAAARGSKAEWAYETVLSGTVAECPQALRQVRNAAPKKVSTAEQWLLKMLGADADISASVTIRRNRSPEEMGQGDREECESLLEKARLGLHEAAFYLGRDGHAVARRALRASIGNDNLVANAFADCQRHCLDDLRDWERCAISLLPRWGAPKGLVERLLDAALESGTDGSWLPAFYVLGRWRILARYESPSGWNADADHRAWAYEDAEVRAKTLAVIRSFKDSPLLNNAPEMRRHVVIANFAAVALVCGDESLARELVSRIPRPVFVSIVREAAQSDTDVFNRLWALSGEKTSSDDHCGGGATVCA